MIGHLHTEHGDGVHATSKLIFKELRASWSGRGGGRAMIRDQESSPPVDPGGSNGAAVLAAMDVDKNGLVPGAVEEFDSNRKRAVDSRHQFTPASTANQPVMPGTMVVQASPSGEQDPKRIRTGVNLVMSGLNKSSNLLSSAGSEEGRLRDQ